MAGSEHTASDAITIHELFKESQKYQMPLFQRPYEWQADEQLKRFWEDFSSLLSGETETIFLGALVLQAEAKGTSKQSTKFTVIDGQQRITTFFVLICVLAKVAKERGWDDRFADIVSEYLLLSLSKEKNHAKLQPTMPDNRQFNKILENLEGTAAVRLPPFGDENGYLVDCFNFIKGKLDEHLDELTDDPSLALQGFEWLVEVTTDRFEIVQIVLTKSHNANEVFDRLNSAGRPLQVIDLVRNEMFQLVSDDYDLARELYDQAWLKFEDLFSEGKGAKGPKELDRLRDGYFFPYLLTIDSSATKNRLMKGLRDFWNGSFSSDTELEKAKAIVNHMSNSVRWYLALEEGIKPSGIPDTAWIKVQRLGRIPMPGVCYPFFMSAMEALSKKEISLDDFIGCCDVIESFLVRRGIVGLEPTGLHAIFKKLWENTKGKPGLVAKSIISKTISYPEDNEVVVAVAEQDMYRKKVRNFIISEYEISVQNEGIEPLKYLPDMTIDHVMPQYRNGTWLANVSEEEHAALVNTWGNLVPISQKSNSTKGAKSFEETKQLLANETKFVSAKRLLEENETWNASDIQRRNFELSHWAISFWKK